MVKREVPMLYGPCDGMSFKLPPGQTIVTAFDGRFAHAYELAEDGRLVHTASWPAEEFPFKKFETEFHRYASALRGE